MATLNYAFKELSCKIVYYGCGLCGKTTNLIHIHKTVPQKFRGDLVSLATEQDRTLFFDFLPLDLGEVKGFKTKFQLYTVPGQVYYNATRKLVLRGVDGLVFVADSQRDRFQENLDSLENLKQNLAEYGYHLQASPDDAEGIPWVLQYNKRDMPQASSIEELNKTLNLAKVPIYEAVAVNGAGVKDTLKGISSLVIKKLNQDSTPGAGLASEKPAGVSKPVAPVLAASKAANDEYEAMDEKDLGDEADEPKKAAAPATPAKAATPPAKTPPSTPAPKAAAPAPRLPEPKPAATPAKGGKTPPAPTPAKTAPAAAEAEKEAGVPTLNVVKKCGARVRGMGLGSASLTLANLVGGNQDQFQLTGKVSFLVIFGSTWSRKLKYVGAQTKSDEAGIANFHHFTSDDSSGPALDVFVKDDFDKSLYVTYTGSFGEVQITPPGKQPLA